MEPLLMVHFGSLTDPRVERTRVYPLYVIVALVLIGTLGHADGWDDVVGFAEDHRDWLQRLLPLRRGIPSADTLRRVFAALDPAEFNACFMAWTRAVVGATEGKLIAIDGKTLRGSADAPHGLAPRHLVSAWASENRIVLGQVGTGAKGGEVAAVRELVAMLDVKGATVTLDALGCQKETLTAIRARGGDYVVTLKANQTKLHQQVAAAFVAAEVTEEQLPACSRYECSEKAHGRVEERVVTVLDVPDRLDDEVSAAWPSLTALIRVESVRTLRTKVTRETRYYISSCKPDAELLARAIRSHWGIENRLHWVLDMTFNEDRSRVRRGNAPDNFALVRKLATNLIRLETTCERSQVGKRRRAGRSPAYMETVLRALAAAPAGENTHVG